MKVFVAGPYTNGDIAINVRDAIGIGQQLIELGHIPFVPHLFHFWHLLFPGPYVQWTRMDFEWLDVCNVLIRLPGESAGADAEELHAVRRGIPVFHNLTDFLVWAKSKV